jgi:hypothetical protein
MPQFATAPVCLFTGMADGDTLTAKCEQEQETRKCRFALPRSMCLKRVKASATAAASA